jgi:membrane fusion protein, heavy metal efflux system
MMKVLKYFLYISLIINAIVFTSCGKPSAETDGKLAMPTHTHEQQAGEHETESLEITEKQFTTTGIEVGKIVMRNLSGTIKVNGLLDVPPQNLVSISAVMGGFVRQTDLLQGMKVSKGQLIAVIENQDFIQMQQDYLDTKARLEYAELEYKRQEQLAKENVSAVKIFQQTTADVKSLQAKFAALTQRLATVGINKKNVEAGEITNSVSIFAPIGGYVTAVNVNLGKFVSPADVLFEITNTDHLHAELSVYEKDIAKLKIGQKLHFYLANEPEVERNATIYLINPRINADRTIRVHCHLNKVEPNLMPNTYLKAIIDLGETAKTALPDQAIVSFENKFYVFALQNTDNQIDSKIDTKTNNHTDSTTNSQAKHYHFQFIEVQKGVAEHGFTEVILPENFDKTNTQLVLKGAFALLAQLKNDGEDGGHGH